jgi:hypothetical protein
MLTGQSEANAEKGAAVKDAVRAKLADGARTLSDLDAMMEHGADRLPPLLAVPRGAGGPAACAGSCRPLDPGSPGVAFKRPFPAPLSCF